MRRLHPSTRLFGFLLLLTLIAAARSAPDDRQPPNKDEKPAKDPKDEKPAEERQPFTIRVEVILRQAKDEPKEEKLPSPKEEKSPVGKDEKLQRYSDLLRSENVLVRKRAALVLTTLGPDAFPALLELADQEKDLDLKRVVLVKLNGRPGGPEPIYSTPEKIEALLKALAGAEPEPGRRQVACQFLPILYLSRFADAEHKQKIKTALEETLLDASPDVQAAAAEARERIDQFDAGVTDPSKVGAPQTVQLTLNEDLLRGVRLSPEKVLEAIQKSFPKAEAKLTAKNVIECRLNQIERVLLLERVRVPEKTGERLKSLVTKVEVVKDEEPK